MTRHAALLVIAACGAAPPAAHRDGIAGEDDAIEAFQAAWRRDVRPTIAERGDAYLRRIDDQMQAADALGLYHAEAKPCAEGVRLIEELERGGHSFVVHGTVAALRHRDRCWAVMFLGGMKRDVHGWLDPSGELIVAWRIPEG